MLDLRGDLRERSKHFFLREFIFGGEKGILTTLELEKAEKAGLSCQIFSKKIDPLRRLLTYFYWMAASSTLNFIAPQKKDDIFGQHL